MSHGERWCRTCLAILNGHRQYFSLETIDMDEVNLKDKLKACIPEMV